MNTQVGGKKSINKRLRIIILWFDGQFCVEKRDEAGGTKVQGWVTALGSLS